MTPQELIDKSMQGMKEQGKYSFDQSLQMCFYRYKDAKCAIGQIIPDDQYTPILEGRGVILIFEYLNIVGEKHTPEEMLLINVGHMLQAVHDKAAIEYWSFESYLQHVREWAIRENYKVNF